MKDREKKKNEWEERPPQAIQTSTTSHPRPHWNRFNPVYTPGAYNGAIFKQLKLRSYLRREGLHVFLWNKARWKRRTRRRMRRRRGTLLDTCASSRPWFPPCKFCRVKPGHGWGEWRIPPHTPPLKGWSQTAIVHRPMKMLSIKYKMNRAWLHKINTVNDFSECAQMNPPNLYTGERKMTETHTVSWCLFFLECSSTFLFLYSS